VKHTIGALWPAKFQLFINVKIWNIANVLRWLVESHALSLGNVQYIHEIFNIYTKNCHNWLFKMKLWWCYNKTNIANFMLQYDLFFFDLNHVPSTKNYSHSCHVSIGLKPSGNMTISGVIFGRWCEPWGNISLCCCLLPCIFL